jgi:hypothetical protein
MPKIIQSFDSRTVLHNKYKFSAVQGCKQDPISTCDGGDIRCYDISLVVICSKASDRGDACHTLRMPRH